MKKKLKSTFIGAILLMSVVTLFSFHSSKKSFKASSVNICAIPGTGDNISIYLDNI